MYTTCKTKKYLLRLQTRCPCPRLHLKDMPKPTSLKPQPTQLPRECHQLRIQRNRQQEVIHHHRAQWPNRHQDIDLPIFLNRKPAHKHHSRHPKAEQKRVLELLTNLFNCLEERHIFYFLAGRPPLHVH